MHRLAHLRRSAWLKSAPANEHGAIPGRVTRIDPAVENGTMTVGRRALNQEERFPSPERSPCTACASSPFAC